MEKSNIKKSLKKIWHFLWHDDSIWSWIVNILLAFVLVKFGVYPVLSLILSTPHPAVAIVSNSMEHDTNFDEWWTNHNGWYINNNITKKDFMSFPLKNGFNKGDIIAIFGKQPKDIKIGDITVFRTRKRVPIIHRVVGVSKNNDEYIYSTKGDNNEGQIRSWHVDETNINQQQIIGTAFFKIPLLGYIKIWSVNLVCNIHQFSFCLDA